MPFSGRIGSGVVISDNCRRKYDQMKTKKNITFILYKISSDNSLIDVDYVGQKGETYDDFVAKLLAAGEQGEGRYAVYDCCYKQEKTSKLVFITWVNDISVGVKQRMLYASSKKALFDELDGVAVDMQCNDQEDLAWSRMVQLCSSKYE